MWYTDYTILNYLQEHSEKIGGINKVLEVDELKFNKQKYDIEHTVDGVFAGAERYSDRMFLVAVHDRRQNMLTCWIEPGKMIHYVSCILYDALENINFKYFKIMHIVNFKKDKTYI